jgi:hypothetical protein
VVRRLLTCSARGKVSVAPSQVASVGSLDAMQPAARFDPALRRHRRQSFVSRRTQALTPIVQASTSADQPVLGLNWVSREGGSSLYGAAPAAGLFATQERRAWRDPVSGCRSELADAPVMRGFAFHVKRKGRIRRGLTAPDCSAGRMRWEGWTDPRDSHPTGGGTLFFGSGTK